MLFGEYNINMRLLQFLAEKVVIVEVMLIILHIAMIYFGLSIPLLTTFLLFLTPVSVVAFLLWIVFSLLNTRIVQTALGIVLGGIILYYLITYIL